MIFLINHVIFSHVDSLFKLHVFGLKAYFSNSKIISFSETMRANKVER